MEIPCEVQSLSLLSHLLICVGLPLPCRGIGVNMIAVAIPIAITIFVTDILKSLKHRDWQKKES
jgi:hypothetical protein